MFSKKSDLYTRIVIIFLLILGCNQGTIGGGEDKTPPSISSISPADGAADVEVSSNIIITFNEGLGVDKGTVILDGNQFTDDEISINGNTVTVNPQVNFTEYTTYTGLTISGFSDDSGNIMDSDTRPAWSFTTEDIAAPSVVSIVPAPGATGVLLNSNILITFDEPLGSTKGSISLDSITFTSGEITIIDNSVLVNPASNFAPSTTYTAISITGFEDESGRTMSDDIRAGYTFQTGTVADTDPPLVTGISPVDGSDFVSVSTDIVITFNEDLSSTRGSVTLAGTTYEHGVNAEISISDDTVVVSPDTDLAEDTVYTSITIAGFEDISGNTMVSDTDAVYQFTTVSTAIGERHPSSGPYSPVDEGNWGSASYPTGAHYVGGDLEFTVYAGNADRVLLEIYDEATGEDAMYDYWMQQDSYGYWHAKLDNVPDKCLYAFRCWGSNWPWDADWSRGNSTEGYISDVDTTVGNRYNPNKVLFDPYAFEITHDAMSFESVAEGATGAKYASGDGNRHYDTGRFSPKSIALMENTTNFPNLIAKPNTPLEDSIIYEVHLRGLTADDSSRTSTATSGYGITSSEQGTYAGAAKLAPYLADLGITAVEFLPVQETENDNNDFEQSTSGDNYWGYMTLNYFSPDRRYSSDKSWGGPTREFITMVNTFHSHGIEVLIDVVYNHTGEGGTWGSDPTGNTINIKSFRGFDNRAYYQLTSDKRYFYDNTGCGGNFNCANEVVRLLIIDSLNHWKDKLGVDGYRFDLASVLGNPYDIQQPGGEGFAFHWTFPQRIRSEVTGAKLIAEAWAIGDGTYQVGNFPPGWADWNGKYRDAARLFIKGGPNRDGGNPSLSDGVHGNYDMYNDAGGPQYSINFIVAHDGFTLADLVSYTTQWNDQDWPWGKSDGGTDDNKAWDHNLPGHALSTQSRRRQQVRNFLTLLMFSRGTPMITGGDEFGRTQNGNNNTYNLDSNANWLQWEMITRNQPQGTDVVGGMHNNLGTDANTGDNVFSNYNFAKYVFGLRTDHEALRQADYTTVTYSYDDNNGDNNWGSGLDDGDRCVSWMIDGAGDKFLVMFNAYDNGDLVDDGVTFNIPSPSSGKKWVVLIDTADWAEGNDNYWEESDDFVPGSSYGVHEYSCVVLKEVSN
jgi:isoamylase